MEWAVYLCKHVHKYKPTEAITSLLVLEIDFFKQKRKEVKNDFDVLSKVFHKRLLCSHWYAG